MSTVSISKDVGLSGESRPIPTLPSRRIGAADSLHSFGRSEPAMVFICDPWSIDGQRLLDRLSRRGYNWTRYDLDEPIAESAPNVVQDLFTSVQDDDGTFHSFTVFVVEQLKPVSGPAGQHLSFDGLSLDWRRHEVRVREQFVDFSKTEFDLLFLLARHPGVVLSRREILEVCKGESYPVTDRSIDVQMVAIRRKLGSVRHYLQTVRGVGYRFDPQRQVVSPK